jgi:hypothetical protein
MINILDLQDLYKTYFNKYPYHIPQNENPKGTIHKSKHNQPFNKIGAYGQDIWGAITLQVSTDLSIEIEACTVAVNLSKIVVKTAVSERKGTVKETFNTDDYKFTIKGFLIDKNRFFPEEQINTLVKIFESTEPVSLLGGYPELFLEGNGKVVISTLDFPEVQGKSYWIRPFSMTCESDFIEDLIID